MFVVFGGTRMFQLLVPVLWPCCVGLLLFLRHLVRLFTNARGQLLLHLPADPPFKLHHCQKQQKLGCKGSMGLCIVYVSPGHDLQLVDFLFAQLCACSKLLCTGW